MCAFYKNKTKTCDKEFVTLIQVLLFFLSHEATRGKIKNKTNEKQQITFKSETTLKSIL